MATSTIKNDLAIVNGVVTPNSNNIEIDINKIIKSGHIVEMTIRGTAKKNLVYGDVLFTLPFKPKIAEFIVDSLGASFYIQTNGIVTTANSYNSGDRVCYFIRNLYISSD